MADSRGSNQIDYFSLNMPKRQSHGQLHEEATPTKLLVHDGYNVKLQMGILLVQTLYVHASACMLLYIMVRWFIAKTVLIMYSFKSCKKVGGGAQFFQVRGTILI